MNKELINEIIEKIKQRIITQINPESIIVFGSIAKGNVTHESDLDLFLVFLLHKFTT